MAETFAKKACEDLRDEYWFRINNTKPFRLNVNPLAHNLEPISFRIFDAEPFFVLQVLKIFRSKRFRWLLRT